MSSPKPSDAVSGKREWYLESATAEVGKTWLVRITPIPFRVGRQEDCHLLLPSSDVSRNHAEIDVHDGVLWLRDCGSTNGTFVNHQRLQLTEQRPLQDGDVIHFGRFEFRLKVQLPFSEAAPSSQLNETSLDLEFSEKLKEADFSHVFVLQKEEKAFRTLLQERTVLPHFQPIVRLSDQVIVAYELLGRGFLDGQLASPKKLFDIASRLLKSIELSELFRDTGLLQAQQHGLTQMIFFNTIPDEMNNERTFYASLGRVRQIAPHIPLVMEVSEAAVTDIAQLQRLRQVLHELHIQLAYDDFGTGQSRLLELPKVPPDYVKFDIGLIRNIHREPAKQNLLRKLIPAARDVGAQTLAEGTEYPEEVQTCLELGFDLAQGYHFGKPIPLQC